MQNMALFWRHTQTGSYLDMGFHHIDISWIIVFFISDKENVVTQNLNLQYISQFCVSVSLKAGNSSLTSLYVKFKVIKQCLLPHRRWPHHPCLHPAHPAPGHQASPPSSNPWPWHEWRNATMWWWGLLHWFWLWWIQHWKWRNNWPW